MSKFYNIDTSTNLGGVDASDIKVSSQKSIKTYIDGGMQTVAYIGSDESTSDVIDSATGNPIASKWLKDVNDVNFFPVTHVDSVRDDNNDPLSTLLDGKQDLITTGNKLEWDLVAHPDIPTVYNATLTIKKNGTSVGSFTANASSNKTINITVPTTAEEVSALPSTTKYGASLDMSLNSSTYVLTIQLKDQDDNNLGEAKTVDLPLESMVTGGSYDNTSKKITLTQQSGGNVEISIGDIISGLQPAINSTNKLSADYISNGTTNKAYTATEKTKLSGIEEGAEVNVQSDWNVDDNSSDAFIKNKPTIGDGTLTIKQNQTPIGTFTANQSTASDINITVPTKTSELTNDSGFLNGNSKLNSLSDVGFPYDPQQGEALVYDGTEWTNGYPNEPVSITYSELVTLRNNSTLVPNRTYRITDYVTEINPYMTNLLYYMLSIYGVSVDMEIARVSPNYVQYDILATAIDSSHLSEDCRIAPHSGVSFFDNYDITSWKLKYTIDNDVERFAWAKNYYDVTFTLDDGTVNGVMIKTKLKSKVNNVEGCDTYLFTAKVDGQCVNYIFGMENGHTPAASETVYEVFQGVALTISSATQVLGKGVVYSMEDCFSNKLCYDYLNIQYKLFAITDVTTDSDLSEHITDIKTSLVYNDNGTRARFSSIVSIPLFDSPHIIETPDFNNFDWYYTFDLYDETNNTHTNVFYLCDNVTLEKSLSSFSMYELEAEMWNLPYNVFQYNKSYVTESEYSEINLSRQRHVLLHSLDLSEYVYGNVWYYDGSITNDLIDVETPKHVYGTIFVNSFKIKTCGCLYGKFINSSNVNIEGSECLVSYNLKDSIVGYTGGKATFINAKHLSIGEYFSGYICNCGNILVGNGCNVNFIARHDNDINWISIGNNNTIKIIVDTSVTTNTSIRNLAIGNNVGLLCIEDSEKFTGVINNLTIGDNCESIILKNDLYCEYVVVEPCTSNVILTSEGLPSGRPLSNIIVRQLLYDSAYYYGTNGSLSTDFITESFNTPHKVGRNSSGVVVCYVEEDLVAPAAYAPNGVTYTVRGNNIIFTIPSGYTMYWTLDGRNPSIRVRDGYATTSTTVDLTDGQTIKYISYNSSLPQDRWATQIYSYTHHVNE